MEKDGGKTFSSDVTTTSHIPLLVDPMSNDVNDVYAMWPERVYIIQGDRILFIWRPFDGLVEDFARKALRHLFQE